MTEAGERLIKAAHEAVEMAKQGPPMIEARIEEIVAEGGVVIKVYEETEVVCETHNVRVRWKDLTPIGRLCVEEGLDSADDLPCLLLPKKDRP